MRIFTTALLVSSFMLAMPAVAKNWKNDRPHDDDRVEWRTDHDDVRVAIDFGSKDRTVIRNYLRSNYAHCPPGLAKKHNGCLPPGQAKKYNIGSHLDYPYRELPGDLLDILGPAPRGTFYAMVDKDVLLVSEAGKKILDAVTLLSAVQ